MTKECKIFENKDIKAYKSEHYNTIFDKNTGYFERWGKNRVDDPQEAPAPEIADICITTICSGIPNENGEKTVCPYCYKSCTNTGHNMTFDTFKNIFDRFDKSILGQIALGVDSEGTANPDMFKMMHYMRDNGVIPNLTIANISLDTANKLSVVAGACAVSHHGNKNVCYDTVKRLTDTGMEQINIHFMVSDETYDTALEVVEDILTDGRLSKLNAIVFLSLKQKGRGATYTKAPDKKFTKLIETCLEKKIRFGFDSCSAHKFLNAIRERDDYERMEQMVDCCESSCFSIYVNAYGLCYPCSFSENEMDGIDVFAYDSFEDVWNHKNTLQFRDRLLSNGRECPLYVV